MDPSAALSLLIVLLIGVLGFFGKRMLDEIKQLREDFAAHQLNDAVAIARLEEKVDRFAN